MIENIKSAEDYANVVIETILEAEQEVPVEEQMSSTLITIQMKNICELADTTWAEYIKGDRETFLFSDEEFIDLTKKSFEEYVQSMLNKMSDDGFIQAGIDNNGDIVYNITEEGKKIVTNNI